MSVIVVKDGKWPCSCPACQKVMGEDKGPRPPCEKGRQYKIISGNMMPIKLIEISGTAICAGQKVKST